VSAVLESLAATIRTSRGLKGKRDIAGAVAALGLSGRSPIAVGDDCAAIPDGEGFLLFAIEGFIQAFVEAEPWFAGYCGVMVNLSDIAAMGGRPIAVVDALWAPGADAADPVFRGLRAGAEAYGVPIVGGHTNALSDGRQLAVAVLGRAKKLLTSFDAAPGDDLVAAVDLRGAFRGPASLNWDASTLAPPARLRSTLAILPGLAEDGLCRAGKDISMAGLVGTALMLLECSDVGGVIDIAQVPRPEGVALDRWLMTFPSYGYILSVAPRQTGAVLARFADAGIAAAAVGRVDASKQLRLREGAEERLVWDLRNGPLIGCGTAMVPAEDGEASARRRA
jgi:AIR synthase-related protein